MVGDGETMSIEQERAEAFDRAMQGGEPRNEFEKELFAIVKELFIEYEQDGIDFICRLAKLAIGLDGTYCDLEAVTDRDPNETQEQFVRRMAREHRDEKRLDLMLAYCRETGEVLDDVEKETRNMNPKEAAFYLSATRRQSSPS